VSYRILPHTADWRAELEARDLDGLYQSAVDWVRETVVGSSPVEAREVRTLDPSGEDDEERFFRFVRELVFLYDAEGFLPARVERGVPLVLLGDRFDPMRHASERPVKALTRHGYLFEHTPEGFLAELILDL